MQVHSSGAPTPVVPLSKGTPVPATETAATNQPAAEDSPEAVAAADVATTLLREGQATSHVTFAELSAFEEKFSLGKVRSPRSESLTQTLMRARYAPSLVGHEDMVILKQDGQYQVFELDGPGLVIDDDLDNYKDLRKLNQLPQLPENAEIVAVMADNKNLRFLQPQPGPAYARPADPPPILPAEASTAERQERLAQLQENFAEVADRLQQMASDLGETQDHRGIFTNLYNITTQSGQEEVQRLIDNGQLREAEFLCTLCIDFANRYFDAYDAYTHGAVEDVSEPWRNAFDFGREAQKMGTTKLNVSQVLGLSIVAHIINDLPQTLQAVGYTEASDKESTLRGTYDFFDAALMNQKTKIMDALTTHYGINDTLVLDKIAEQLPFNINNKGQRELFAIMRNTARERAESLDPGAITDKATSTGDWVRRLMPGLT